MVTWLIAGLQKAAHKAINYENLKGINQGPDENPALFLSPLTEALQKYTKLDSSSMEGLLYLHAHFTFQSASEIRCKLQRLEDGPRISQRELLSAAFKVFSNRDEETNKQKKWTT